jgi:hypothetical protein
MVNRLHLIHKADDGMPDPIGNGSGGSDGGGGSK